MSKALDLVKGLAIVSDGSEDPADELVKAKSDDPSKPITGYRMGSVVYVDAPAYELPDGGQVRRPGLDPAARAQPPVIDDGRDPYVSELARLSGRLVNPDHGILALVHGRDTDGSEG